MVEARVVWDEGTAYDLFISLDVLHRPAEFDVRGIWAAGVRARMPLQHRQMLEQSVLLFHGLPFPWLYGLRQPKDGSSALWALRQIPPAERLPELVLNQFWPQDYKQILKDVSRRGGWREEEREELAGILRRSYRDECRKVPSLQELGMILDWWSRPDEFGERYLEALSVYQDVFFSQEERRIRPALQQGLAHAKVRAEELSLADLLEELTQGVRFEELPTKGEVVLVPSFWCTPLVYFGQIDEMRSIYLYGARPSDASLVPGEMVPDALLRALKALSDSTRLQILQYLAEQPLSPTQLSHRLRLRVPTVVHHLGVLRLAGLVRLTVGEEAVTKNYAFRPEGIESAYIWLNHFLSRGDNEQGQS
jgi:DNA-binding transcriptional ArsR family regulator